MSEQTGTTLVLRLRNFFRGGHRDPASELMREAADEIERLSAENEALGKLSYSRLLQRWSDNAEYRSEIKRLRMQVATVDATNQEADLPLTDAYLESVGGQGRRGYWKFHVWDDDDADESVDLILVLADGWTAVVQEGSDMVELTSFRQLPFGPTVGWFVQLASVLGIPLNECCDS